MKVLQINSVCGLGSTGRIAADIDNMLSNLGHNSYIAYGRGLPINCNHPIKIGSKYDNYKHVALTRVLDMHGYGSKKATMEFTKEIEKIDPDIIHLHNIHGYYINIEVLFNFLKRANKPVIWTLHDCWSFTGHCSHFDYIGCDKWKTNCNNCPQKKEYPKSYFMDNSENNYLSKKRIFTGVKNLTIITPSKWLANKVKGSFLGDYPVRVINNGINLDVFRPRKSNFREINNLVGKFVILGVANIWGRKKGLNHFLELSGRLKENEVIVLVGLTKKQKKMLPENILGLLKTTNIDELAEIYSAADVFVNPTLEDTFPTTNLEAKACGVPVITFNTGGSVESVDTSYDSIVEKNNFNELYTAISNYKDKMRSSINFERIKQFDKNERYREYIDYYTDLTK